MTGSFYKKVLIVDDSRIDQFVSAAVIKKNYFANEVVSFTSVAPAIAHLQDLVSTGADLPEIIFLDINMPVLDGFDFLDSYLLLPDKVHALCTVVMISSSNSDDDLARVRNYPVVHSFFSKPLSNHILNSIKDNFAGNVAC